MSFKSTAVRVVMAAALAVAGVAGMGWAQPGTSNLGKQSAFTEVTPSEVMVMGLNVPVIAEIKVEAVNHTPAEMDKIKTYAVGGTTTRAAGNLGRVKVKCNQDNWDVHMTLKNQGLLKKDGNGVALQKGGSLGSSLEDVKIGLEVGVMMSATATVPTLLETVPEVWMGEEIGFSQVLTQNTAPVGWTNANIKQWLGQRSVEDVKQYGFAPPINPATNSEQDAEITFVVNGGLGLSTAASSGYRLRGNEGGTYADTLTFKLIGGW